MRVLFLSLMMPAPANNGHKMRVLALLKAFGADEHEVTLLTFKALDEADGDLALLKQVCGDVEVVPIRSKSITGGSDYLRRLRAVVGCEPFAARQSASPAMAARIRHHLDHGGFDAVVADSIFSLVNLPPTSIPILLNNVDLEHVILQRYAQLASNPAAKRLYAWLESRKLKAWEINACRRATVAMACSDHDRQLLQEWCPSLPAVIVPNVIDVADYVPTTDGDGGTVLYQGAMDWYPNRDAVQYFVTAILPELRTLVPNVRLVVAGRNPPEAFRRQLAGVAGVELTGTVPDMRPVVAAAQVCVVPLRIGSGTRLKILEAAAMAKPIVSTRLGAEGLHFVDGKDILLADEPRAFAHAVAELLTDGAKRARLGASARRRVEEEYSVSVLCARVRAALLRAVPGLCLPARAFE